MNLADLTKFKLTPAEMNKVLYHRANLAKPGIDENGYPVTIYATGIQIPEGPNKGKFVSVPGFVGGKVIDNDDELWEIWKKDILEEKYPIYPDAKTLNKRDKELHQIMELDMQAIPKQKEQVVSPMYADPFGNSI